jgi:hypothetical protein
MSARTLGAHNLHDSEGVPTFFADAVLYTEAIPGTIRAKARAARARAAARVLGGYTLRVCKEQRDLAVALKRRHYRVHGVRYLRAHRGRAHVTPNRGTFCVETYDRRTGAAVVFIVEHRINAAFPPHIRGEADFRAQCWHLHTDLTLALIEDYLTAGWCVRIGGDLNTPPDVKGYKLNLVHERGRGLDRLASSGRLNNFEVLSRSGSDHPRIRAVMG